MNYRLIYAIQNSLTVFTLRCLPYGASEKISIYFAVELNLN